MAEQNLPVGQLFSHVYLSGGQLLRDSPTFRRRMGVFCQTKFSDDNGTLGTFIRQELGLQVPANGFGFYLFEDFFVSVEVRYALNLITLISRFYSNRGYLAKEWLRFVERVLKEENMGYQLDPRGGVHFLVDEAFERNRQALIPSLGHARYAGVLAAFESAYGSLDSEPQDTKHAVRSIFEALEILAKLMVPKSPRLDKQSAEWIRDQAKDAYAGDETANRVADKMFAGFVDWIDGLHFYRHGQGVEDVVAPPLDMAIFSISTGTNYLRWLLEIDLRRPAA